MKILLVHPYLSFYGGAELVIDKFVSIAKKRNHTISIISLSLGKEVKDKFKDVKFFLPQVKCKHEIRSYSFFSALGILKEIFILRGLIKRSYKNYDVINVHNFPSTWATAGIDKPIVWMCNELPDLWNNPNPNFILKTLRFIGTKLDVFIVRHFTKTVCVADENNAKRFKERYKINPKIINYGIDYKFFSKSKLDKSLIKKYSLADRFVVIQVGMLTPQKNQMDSLKAIRKLVKKIPEIKLILAGMGRTKYEKELKDYIKRNRLNKFVILTGQVDQKTVRDLYSLSRTALFPIKIQGGWLSPFESLSAGVPIIVYPSMGAADLIKKNKLGAVSKDLSESILTIYRNYNKLSFKQRLARSKRWVKENLTWERFAEQMLLAFKQAINKENSK